MGDLPARTSRILRAGLPLPVVFRDVLRHLLENGRAAPVRDLVKVIRDSREEVHGMRALSYWESWEDLTDDLLEELEDHNLIARNAGEVILTWKVQEGSRVRPIPGVRITVHTGGWVARQEALAYARTRASSYRQFLEQKKIFDGKVKTTFMEHWDSLFPEPEKVEEPDPARKEQNIESFAQDYAGSHVIQESSSGRRKRGEIASFVRGLLESCYPDWITGREAAAAFNNAFPDQEPIRLSSAWNRMQQAVWEGLAERRDGKTPGPGRSHTEFRWKG